jgi:hypothetical protein
MHLYCAAPFNLVHEQCRATLLRQNRLTCVRHVNDSIKGIHSLDFSFRPGGPMLSRYLMKAIMVAATGEFNAA